MVPINLKKELLLLLLLIILGNAEAQFNVTANKKTTPIVVSKLLPIPYQNIADWEKGFKLIMRSNMDRFFAEDASQLYKIKSLEPFVGNYPKVYVTYKELADKILTVEQVKTYQQGGTSYTSVWLSCESKMYMYDFMGDMEEFRQSRSTIPNLVPYDELIQAQKLLIGKKFSITINNWLQNTTDGGFEEYQSYNGAAESVTITKVGYGRDDQNPIRLVFKAKNGNEYFTDVCISRTNSNHYTEDGNVPDNFIDNVLNLGKEYLTDEAGNDLPVVDQSALENKLLYDGIMRKTAEKIWGKPDKEIKNNNQVELTYNKESAILVFENDILVKSFSTKENFDKIKLGMSRSKCKAILQSEPEIKRTSEMEGYSREYWFFGKKAILVFDTDTDKLIQLELDKNSKTYKDVYLKIGLK